MRDTIHNDQPKIQNETCGGGWTRKEAGGLYNTSIFYIIFWRKNAGEQREVKGRRGSLWETGTFDTTKVIASMSFWYSIQVIWSPMSNELQTKKSIETMAPRDS